MIRLTTETKVRERYDPAMSLLNHSFSPSEIFKLDANHPDINFSFSISKYSRATLEVAINKIIDISRAPANGQRLVNIV